MQNTVLTSGIATDRLRKNVTDIQNCLLSNHPEGQKPAKLVAVTKTVAPDVINQLIGMGVTDIAENRAQVALPKLGSLLPDYRLHWIGRLQTNKVKSVMPHVYMLHSLDRLELAQEVNRRAGELGRVLPVLVQVNIAQEPQKTGFSMTELIPFLKIAHDFSSIHVKGLMAIMPAGAAEKELTGLFHGMKVLYDNIREEGIPGIEMAELSMGMSGDYVLAAREGATMVRIGTALYR